MIASRKPWPESPDVYGYLSLDERGNWLIRGQSISRASLIDHLQKNYQPDESGQWFVKNGWQRAFVALAYTPWIFRVDGHGNLANHCHKSVDTITNAFMDETGALILDTPNGPGLIVDSDLDWALERLGGLTDDTLDIALAQPSGTLTTLKFASPTGAPLPVQRLDRAQVANHFGFVTTPRPLAKPTPQ